MEKLACNRIGIARIQIQYWIDQCPSFFPTNSSTPTSPTFRSDDECRQDAREYRRPRAPSRRGAHGPGQAAIGETKSENRQGSARDPRRLGQGRWTRTCNMFWIRALPCPRSHDRRACRGADDATSLAHDRVPRRRQGPALRALSFEGQSRCTLSARVRWARC